MKLKRSFSALRARLQAIEYAQTAISMSFMGRPVAVGCCSLSANCSRLVASGRLQHATRSLRFGYIEKRRQSSIAAREVIATPIASPKRRRRRLNAHWFVTPGGDSKIITLHVLHLL